MPRAWLFALPFAVALVNGCRPAPVVTATGASATDNARRIVATLGEAGMVCEPTKENFVHCNVEGIDVVIGVTVAATGMQLTMLIPFHQPACAVPTYHGKIAKFNSDYFMVVAGCVNDKTLMLAHRSHLFRAGLDKKDLQGIVKHWFLVAIGAANEEGLLEPVAAEPPPKKSEEPESGKVKSW